MKIDGVLEVAIKVRNLEESAAFYEGVLGLERGIYDEPRRWLFLWVGGKEGMIVLQEEKGQWPQQHFAFKVDPHDLSGLKIALEDKGVKVEGPVELEWMNAKSLYFIDPDENSLEFCALNG